MLSCFALQRYNRENSPPNEEVKDLLKASSPSSNSLFIAWKPGKYRISFFDFPKAKATPY